MAAQETNVVRVRARVRLTPTENGGRASAIADGYRPHVRLADIDGYASVKLGVGQILAPGSTRDIEVVLVGSPAFVSSIAQGQEFTMHEGPKTVGSGVIIEIVSADA